MKKILIALFLLFVFAGTVFAADDLDAMLAALYDRQNVAVVIEVQPTIQMTSHVRQKVIDKLRDFLPSNRFTILPVDQIENELTYYKEDKGITNEVMLWRSAREDIQAVCAGFGADYAFIVTITTGTINANLGLLVTSTSYTANTICEIRMMDIASGRYKASARLERKHWGEQLENAFMKGVNDILSEIKIDLSNI